MESLHLISCGSSSFAFSRLGSMRLKEEEITQIYSAWSMKQTPCYSLATPLDSL